VTSITTWGGFARYIETHVIEGERSYRTLFEGEVTWRKDPPDPSLPAGWVSYSVASGRIHLTYGGTRNFVGQVCTDEAAMDLDPAVRDPERTNSFLIVHPDGTYGGAVYVYAVATITRRCATGFVGSFTGDLRMGLSIDGTVTSGRRMQGDMVPHSVGGQTETGSWDFAAR
jgi:hypothetical protein